jgi:CrcB protein
MPAPCAVRGATTEVDAVSGLTTTLWIALGGALGSVARYWIAVWALPVSRALPWGTIGINVLGSFVIGFFGTLTLASGRHPLPETARLFVMVGICGGFTTFSSFSLQTLDLLRAGAWPRAMLNVVLSILLCLAAVAAGHALAARLGGSASAVVQNQVEENAA